LLSLLTLPSLLFHHHLNWKIKPQKKIKAEFASEVLKIEEKWISL